MYAEALDDGVVRCVLCPHFCVLKEGQKGLCRARENLNGRLMSLNHGIATAIHLDPIEKKPFYHYRPGSLILSVGSFGCNFSCGFCQNHSISLGKNFEKIPITAAQLLKQARRLDMNIGMAYTYNEPTVFYEQMLETATLIKEAGMDNVLVSNGYINPEPLEELIPLMDAANIDLKAFEKPFYRKYVRGEIDPVKRTIERLHESPVHLEITHLLIQGFNDNIRAFTRMCDWIADLSPDIPFHVTRYYPAYRFTTHATDIRLLKHYADVAKSRLNYVYIGNVAYADNNTYCPRCRHIIVRRTPALEINNVDNRCPNCGEPIPIVV